LRQGFQDRQAPQQLAGPIPRSPELVSAMALSRLLDRQRGADEADRYSELFSTFVVNLGAQPTYCWPPS
jgi:hypothetical protein